MSSRSNNDEMLDYVEDKSQNEDGTLFIPVPDSRPDNWTVFYCGILIGIIGGGLVTLAPWLAGLLIFSGYGLTVLTLKAPGNRFSRALRFGFAFSSIFGAIVLAGEALFPKTAWGIIVIASNHALTFPGIALMPWVLGLSRYVSAVFWPAKSRVQTAPAKRLCI